MPVAEGFFVDWDGNARNTLDPGGGYVCETDPVARYVAITTKGGTLVHEGTFYKTLTDIEKAGIKASFVPGSHPWAGRTKDSESAARRKGDPDMLPTTILVDEAPRCVVRPNDVKDLNRFIRNEKTFLLAENLAGKITHRNADETEMAKWKNGLALHKAWGGADEDFFGIPL